MQIQALNKVIEGTRDERLYLCSKNFGLFAMYYFRPYFKYPLAPYHFEMINDVHDLTDGKIRELVWVMFRESAKTTFLKLYIIWLICYKRKHYINIDSFDKENSERILFDIAYELVNNSLLIRDFGQLLVKARSSEEIKQTRINNFVTDNGIRLEAHSTQESFRGRIHLSERPDFLAIDDFETNKTKESKAYTKQVRDHITEAMGGLGATGSILYLGNYLTEYGNIQWLLDRSKVDTGIRVRNVPVILKDGQPAWPSKYALTDQEAKVMGKVSIEDKRKQLGSFVFSYEMMNIPVDDSMTEFKRDYEQSLPIHQVEAMNCRIFVTIDTAVSKSSSSDFTGITINYVNFENKWHVKSFHIKFNPKELIDYIFTIWEKIKPETIGIEKTIYLQAIQPFLEDEMRKRGVFINITELQHNLQNKETRIRGLIPRWESKSIIFIEGECEHLKDEMRVFPNGQHDDTLDSLAYQIQIAQAPYRESYDEKVDRLEEREKRLSNDMR